jgi:hypothetical protein
MASTTETSFGKRLESAQALATHIGSFTNYTALNTELTVANLNAIIDELKILNADIAGKLQAYSMTVDDKQKLFSKDPDSIIKIVTPIVANVRSIFGKDSREANNTTTLVTKIRGEKTKKVSGKENDETISQSERSYGTIMQTFADLIVVLDSFGTNYAPAKPEYSTTKLKQKLDLAAQLNTQSVQTYGQLKIQRDARLTKYEDLAALCQRLKDTVKAQYGTSSVEYKLVKGLKV